MADFERNDMEKNNLSVKIFDFVREHDGCAAKQIAEALGITKTAVNKILYGSDCCYMILNFPAKKFVHNPDFPLKTCNRFPVCPQNAPTTCDSSSSKTASTSSLKILASKQVFNKGQWRRAVFN